MRKVTASMIVQLLTLHSYKNSAAQQLVYDNHVHLWEG